MSYPSQQAAVSRLVTDSQAAAAKRPPFIVMDDVSMTYGAKGGELALRGFSLRVGNGEFAAIVGPSGCGKSTFLKLASGLRPPSAGGVIVADQEVTGPLKFVGMAFQNPALLPWRTCLQNVMLPLEIVEPFRSRRRRDYQIHRERAYALLKTVGLGDVANRFPWQLSGGMQQRAALCRAVVHDPKLLLLDETFSALDSFTREELWDVLQALWIERAFTAVLVTHDLAEAVYLADIVHVVSSRPGRIIHSEKINLPRQRNTRQRFEPQFVETVFTLRQKIAEARQ
ncbi:MAG: NitT/TauT family transport system ATP-binding protein [Bradyrhizobium sp.]|jgi:NitT/TauT family transport system ATP-binding protein|nr:NitT/TauT family transport system ATP-binding protein [Bradyrhizobium sp.]